VPIRVIADDSDWALAESLFREALVTHRRALGETHPVVATRLNSLSRALVEQGRLDEAAGALQPALDVARPRSDVIISWSRSTRSTSHPCTCAKDRAAAEALAREGLRIRTLAPGLVPSRRRTFIEDDWSVGATKSLLGAALVALGRFSDAETTLLDALHDLEATPSASRRDLTKTVTRLIQLYMRPGWTPERAAMYRAMLGAHRLSLFSS
jgi:tetratricopeptide repeat protein